ncbi:hypothetical protein [Streptomyces sp. NPDC002845]
MDLRDDRHTDDGGLFEFSGGRTFGIRPGLVQHLERKAGHYGGLGFLP